MPELSTYLLTWNPRTWAWEDLDRFVLGSALGQSLRLWWSSGSTKRIEPGDRLFLLRQGREPRGIMAAGWAISHVEEQSHWDEARRRHGETCLAVQVQFECVLNPDLDEILTLERLRSGSLSSINWATPASGIEIKKGANELEQLWAELMERYRLVGPGDLEDSVGAIEGKERLILVRHRARERWLRDQKIAAAKVAHQGRLPCEVCGFDFFQTYGEVGRDYAEVHHTAPLGDRTKPSLTRLEDLAIVCANCHVMIHLGRCTRSLEEVRRLLVCRGSHDTE